MKAQSGFTILEMIGDRWAIEEHFHDAKEIHAAGQQQVRNVWSNIACWNLIGWMGALIDLCYWDDADAEILRSEQDKVQERRRRRKDDV